MILLMGAYEGGFSYSIGVAVELVMTNATVSFSVDH